MKRVINFKTMFWIAAGCVIFVNGFMLAKVYLNRSQVINELELTERELRVPYGYGFSKEDSSARVSLNWATPSRKTAETDWETWRWYSDRRLQLSAAHFNSFEFPTCSDNYRSPRKKAAWVLLEFNGKAYSDFVARAEQSHDAVQQLSPAAATEFADKEFAEKELKEKQKNATEFLHEVKTKQSRLFVIDAAADKSLLDSALLDIEKTRFEEASDTKFLIVPAEVQPDYNRCDNPREPTTEVQITNLAVESLYIPKEVARNLPANTQLTDQPFSARIAYGRFYEPWVSSFTLVNN